MKWYNWISVPVISASVIVFTLAITQAALNGWVTIHDYNSFGEGPFELAIAFFSLPFIGLTLWKLVTEE